MPNIKVETGSYPNHFQYRIRQEDEQRDIHFVRVKNIPAKEVEGQQLSKELFQDYSLYCPTCKKFSKTSVLVKEVPSNNYGGTSSSSTGDWLYNQQTGIYSTQVKANYIVRPKTREVVGYQCDECGYSVNHRKKPVLEINQTYRKAEGMVEYPIWAGHFDRGHIINFRWIMMRASAWNDKLQITSIKQGMSFNTKTGQSYLFAPVDDNGKQLKVNGKSVPKIINVSYWTLERLEDEKYIPESIVKDMYDAVYEKIAINLGYKPKSLAQYKEDIANYNRAMDSLRVRGIRNSIDSVDKLYTFKNIVLFNRAPNINTFQFKTLIDLGRYHKPKVKQATKTYFQEIDGKKKKVTEDYEQSYMFSIMDSRIRKIKNTDPSPVKTILAGFRIQPSKALVRIVSDNITNAVKLPNIMQYFKDINNVRKVIANKAFSTPQSDGKQWYEMSKKNYSNKSAFLEKMIETFGETITCNKICESDHDYLNDSISIYDQILSYYEKERGKPEVKEWLPDFTGTLKDIHDRFSAELDKLRSPNLDLREKYTEDDLKYEKEIDGYIFRLANNTHELKDIGKYMKICVGSYGDRAYARTCNIVLCFKEDKPIVCIELSDNMKAVKQTKLYSNKLPKEQEREIVLKWIKENNLRIDTNDIKEHEEEKKVSDTSNRIYINEGEWQNLTMNATTTNTLITEIQQTAYAQTSYTLSGDPTSNISNRRIIETI